MMVYYFFIGLLLIVDYIGITSIKGSIKYRKMKKRTFKEKIVFLVEDLLFVVLPVIFTILLMVLVFFIQIGEIKSII